MAMDVGILVLLHLIQLFWHVPYLDRVHLVLMAMERGGGKQVTIQEMVVA